MERFIKKYSIVFSLLTFHFTLSYAQGPDTLWTKMYGWIYDDAGHSVIEVSDGYVLAGFFGAGPGRVSDVWLLKTDFSGNILWQKTYGGYHTDRPYAMQKTTDGGYVIAGWTMSFGAGDFDYYILKTDSLGNLLWSKDYGGVREDLAYSIDLTSDGGYIVAGETWSFGAGGSDIWILKLDANGDTVWAKTIGGPDDDRGRSVQQTFDGGYIIAAHSGPFGYYDIYLLKIDATGDTVWSKKYGGPSWDWSSCVKQTPDSGFIVTGHTYTTYQYADFYVIRTDSQGDSLWTKVYGTSGADYNYALELTSDGGFVMTGSAGAASTDIWLLKMDANGDTLWTKFYGWMWDDVAYSVKETSDRGYIITGYADGVGAGWFDLFIIKTEPDVGVEEEITPHQKNQFITTIISGLLRLPEGKKCRVLDVSGREIGPHQIQPGIYFIEVDGKIERKVVKIR